MLYQLPDGRTIEISTYDYLELSDEELRSLVGYAHIGDYINNPLYGSPINKPGRPDKDFDTSEEYKIGEDYESDY